MRLVATDVEHIGTEYEQLACWPRITFARDARLDAAQVLAKGQPLRPEQRWELFTGRGWVPLLEPQSDLPASETAERLDELQRIRAKWAETAAPHTPMQHQGSNRDGLYVSGWKSRTGEFLLTGDTGRRHQRCTTGATAGLGYETARLLASLDNNVIVHGPTDDEVEQAVERMVKPGVDSLHLSTAVASLSWKALIGRPGCPPGNSHREMSRASAGIVVLTWSLGGHPHRHPSQVLPGRLNSTDEVFGTPEYAFAGRYRHNAKV
jgi:hypothetical protein